MSTRIRIIIFVFTLEVALLLTFVVRYMQEHEINELKFHSFISDSLHDHIQNESEELLNRYTLRVAEFARSRNEIIQAFILRDREKLIAALAPALDSLHKENKYFRGIAFIHKDGTVFHHTSVPEKINTKNLKVPFVKDSIEKKKPFGGLVLSPGGLAYRFSHPVFNGQHYVGMVVFAVHPTKEIELVTRNPHIEYGIFIDETFVDRLEKTIAHTKSGKALVACKGKTFCDKKFLKQFPLKNNQTEYIYNGSTFKCFPPIEISNYSGERIGEIITIHDITSQRHSKNQRTIKTIFIFSTIVFSTIAVLYYGIGIILRQVTQLQEHLEKRVIQRTQALRKTNDKLIAEIENHKKTQEELHQLSEKDVLTGVANRRKFARNYDTEWNAAKRDKRMISLLMLDVDYFKAYNDKYGHLAGDEALTQIASAAQQYATRPRDLFARYGGEEFICLLPETSLDAAILVAEKMREKIEKLGIIHEFSAISNVVTVSIGIASMIPDEWHTKEDFIDLADKALYRAKETGRNQTTAS